MERASAATSSGSCEKKMFAVQEVNLVVVVADLVGLARERGRASLERQTRPLPLLVVRLRFEISRFQREARAELRKPAARWGTE